MQLHVQLDLAVGAEPNTGRVLVVADTVEEGQASGRNSGVQSLEGSVVGDVDVDVVDNAVLAVAGVAAH